MKEYAELRYLSLFKEYHLDTEEKTHSITVQRQDDIMILNRLAHSGWRVLSKEGNRYLLERVRR